MEEKMAKKIAIIGGGAAGMMAAIQAAKAGAFVELYERNDRVGKKIPATGNGKCNFSNKNMHKDAYYGSAASYYDTLFSVFGVPETVDFFYRQGMLIKEKDGYLYPMSGQAATVLDILRFALEQYNVYVYTNNMISSIQVEPKSGRFCLAKASGHAVYDALILACGGMAAPKTGSDGNGFQLAKQLGHRIYEVVPALVQLRCYEDFFKSVAGVRTEAGLTLFINDKKRSYVQGELQLTDYGISGIPVFQFSREAAYAVLYKQRVVVAIDFLPHFESGIYEEFWHARWSRHEEQILEQALTGLANKKINQLIIKLAGCKASDSVSRLPSEKRREIEKLYRHLTVSVKQTNGFEQAQVSAGGIPAEELTPYLESQYVPNLYFAGEMVDIDGICGGYNLQWAWTSGAVTGRAAAGVPLEAMERI